MPTRLNARYETALKDPELTAIRKDVALLSAILDDRLGRWAEQSADPDWSSALEADRTFEIRSLIDQRARLAVQEHKRMLDLDQVLTVEQVIMIATTIAAVVAKHVPESATRRAIDVELQTVLSLGDRGELIRFPR